MTSEDTPIPEYYRLQRGNKSINNSMHYFKLENVHISRILDNLLRCKHCGAKLNIGDHIFTKKGSTHPTQYYCKRCAIMLGYIEPLSTPPE